MKAEVAGSSVVITFADHTGDIGFTGYRLERKLGSGSWLSWDGTSWGGSEVLLPSLYFTDYNIADGLYQYRSQATFDPNPPLNFEYSDWIPLGAHDRTGWTFGNYTIPEGTWGEVLTADDIRYTYMWGIDFKASNGEQYTDAQIKYLIDSGLSEVERTLSLTLKKRIMKCLPQVGDIYDEEETPYQFRHDQWNRVGFINLRRRPVISVERFQFNSITEQKIMDLLPWTRLDFNKGMLHAFPKTGPNGIILTNPVAFLGMTTGFGQDYPYGYFIDYTAGFPDASKIDPDLRDFIGKVITLKVLNIIGDGLLAGFSSSSLSMDGLSESFSSTQSPENAYFGARIQVYIKDVQAYLKQNRRKFRTSIMGSI